MPDTLLSSSDGPLTSAYDCAMLDLDGVVYRSGEVIDGVPDVLEHARSAGMTLAFVTNNANRPAAAVGERLRQLGIKVADSDVVTSAQATARELAARLPTGAAVLVVGGEGLEVALRERGLCPVQAADDQPVAVAQGFSPDIAWHELAEGAYVVSAGALWVASNLDATIPTSRGIAPGNGTLVDAVAAAAGRRPDVVAGKPFRPLFDETVARVGADRPLVVGDRLDTDIEGACRVGAASLLVMTGVTDLVALCTAPTGRRPSYVARTLDGLLAEHRAPTFEHERWQLTGWEVGVTDDRLLVHREGDDLDDGLRAVVSAAWAFSDEPSAGANGSLHLSDARRALQMPDSTGRP